MPSLSPEDMARVVVLQSLFDALLKGQSVNFLDDASGDRDYSGDDDVTELAVIDDVSRGDIDDSAGCDCDGVSQGDVDHENDGFSFALPNPPGDDTV